MLRAFREAVLGARAIDAGDLALPGARGRAGGRRGRAARARGRRGGHAAAAPRAGWRRRTTCASGSRTSSGSASRTRFRWRDVAAQVTAALAEADRRLAAVDAMTLDRAAAAPEEQVRVRPGAAADGLRCSVPRAPARAAGEPRRARRTRCGARTSCRAATRCRRCRGCRARGACARAPRGWGTRCPTRRRSSARRPRSSRSRSCRSRPGERWIGLRGRDAAERARSRSSCTCRGRSRPPRRCPGCCSTSGSRSCPTTRSRPAWRSTTTRRGRGHRSPCCWRSRRPARRAGRSRRSRRRCSRRSSWPSCAPSTRRRSRDDPLLHRALPALYLTDQPGRRHGLDRLPGAGERMSSITFWTRLEPFTRSRTSRTGCRPRVNDPLWLLARQWQTGEFGAEDAGTPVSARVRLETLDALALRAPRAARRGKYRAEVPLEARGRARARAGRRRPAPRPPAGGRGRPDVPAHARARGRDAPRRAPRSRASSRSPPDAGPDDAGAAYLAMMAGRVPDGFTLYGALASGLPAFVAARRRAEGEPRSRTAYRAWYEARYGKVGGHGLGAGADGVLVRGLGRAPRAASWSLAAPEYPGGELDWYAFDVAGGPHARTPARPTRPPRT